MCRKLFRRRLLQLFIVCAWPHLLPVAQAASIFWDGTGTSWNATGPWSTSSSSNSVLFDPAAPPGSGDIANFNITTVNSPQGVNLNANQSALGLVFSSSGTVLIQTGSGTNLLTLGTHGIDDQSGSGNDTISSLVLLAGPQTWSNNSSNLLTVSGNTANAAHLLSLDGTGNTTISGVLSGSGGLTKNGSGTLTLSNSNTFSGDVTINSGTVLLANTGALNATNAVSFGAGSTGILGLNGRNVTIGELSNNATLGSPVIQNGAAGSATLTVNNSADTTYRGVVQNGGAGALSLAKSGSGTLLLSGANTFTGGLTINAGVVQLGNPGALNSTAPNGVTFGPSSTGTLSIAGNNLTVSSLNSDATVGTPVVQNGSLSPTTLTVNGAGGSTYAGVLQDGSSSLPLALVKSGAGSLTLSGVNTFTGGLTIQQGTLQVATIKNAATDGALGHVSSVAMGATGQTGTLEYTGGDASTNMPFALAAGGTGAFQVDSAATNLTLSGAISGSGELAKSGSGTLTLGGSNSFTGGATINAGNLVLGSAGALNSNTASAVTFGASSTGTLSLNGFNATVSGLNTNAVVGTPVVQNANAVSATLTVNNSSDNTFSGTLQDGAGGGTLSLVKSGSGTLTLGGSNTFTGGVLINAGNLVLSNAGALNSTSPNAIAFGPASMGVLSLNGNSVTVSQLSSNATVGAPVVQDSGAGAATLTLENTVDNTFGGALLDGGSGRLSLDIFGSGTLTLSGSNAFSGGTTLAGTLAIDSDSALGSGPLDLEFAKIQLVGRARMLSNLLTIDHGFALSGPYDLTLSGSVSITGIADTEFIDVGGTGTAALTGTLSGGNNCQLVKVGPGTLILSGAYNAFLANIQIAAGTLQFGREISLYNNDHSAWTNSLTVSSSATAAFNVGGPGEFTAADIQILSSSVGFQSGSSIGLDTTNAAGGLFDYANVIANPNSGQNSLGVTKLGSGILRLSGNNTFTGGVTVISGALVVGSNSALGTGPLTINGGAVDLGTFSAAVNGTVNLVAGSLSMTGDLTIGTGGLLGSNLTIAANQAVNPTGTTTIDPGASLTINGGTLNTMALVINGTFNFTNGTLGITGPAGLTIGSGSPLGTTVSLGAADHLNVTNTLHLDGTGRLSNVGGNVLANNVLVDAGGRWTVTDGVQSVGTGLVNHGTLIVIDTTINGPVNSPAGSVVNVIGDVTFNQLFSGAGQFFGSGTATFSGGFSPGDSPANVAFQGSASFGAGNALNIELGGTTPGVQFDQVHVAGQLALGGVLNVLLINNFSPALGNSFDILDGGTKTGLFNSLNLPALSAGLAWNTTRLYSSGALSVIDANYLPGDLDRDGHLTSADLAVLLSALTDLSGYQSTHGIGGSALTDQQLLQIADLNGDNQVTNEDIQALIFYLSHSSAFAAGSPMPVPEPSTVVLAAMATIGIGFRRYASRISRATVQRAK